MDLRRPGVAGFTLIELLVVLALFAIVLALGYPAIQNLIHRSKLEGYGNQIDTLLQHARLEAVRRSTPTVVFVDPPNGEVFAFVDINGANPGDPPDGLYQPDDTKPQGTVDFRIAELPLPTGVTFTGPGSQPAVAGFTAVPSAPLNRAIFNIDGSLRDTGAFRLADNRDNYLEVAVEPAATARVDLRKWDGSQWRAQGENNEVWKWN